MTLELSTEEKIIVTMLWVFVIFFLVLFSGIFEGGHEPIKPSNIRHRRLHLALVLCCSVAD